MSAPPLRTDGRLRIVLDTNVVVAGLLWNGPPRRLMELALEPATGTGGLELFSSPALIVELERTLRYSKFESRIKKFNTHVIELVTYYQAIVQLVTPSSVPKVVVRDADDDHVIAAAVAARAELIVTGDRKHLLPLGSHQRIAIVEPVTALMRLISA